MCFTRFSNNSIRETRENTKAKYAHRPQLEKITLERLHVWAMCSHAVRGFCVRPTCTPEHKSKIKWATPPPKITSHAGIAKSLTNTRHLLVNLEKTGFAWKTLFFDIIWQLRGFWEDRGVRENGAQLYGPRVSNCLSHRIVKSLTFRIYGKLEFQCNYQKWPSKPSVLPRVSQEHCFFFDLSQPYSFKLFFQRSKMSKSGNSKIGKPRFTNKCPETCPQRKRKGITKWAFHSRRYKTTHT